MAWQRRVDRALRPLALTQTQLLALLGTATAIEKFQDAVSQAEIGAACGLDLATISAVARKLHDLGLIDRGPHGLDGRKCRVILTREGALLLRQAVAVVNQVAGELDP